MQKLKRKTISLVVLNYNGKKHLKEYFISVYKQTRSPDEVIMMDNLSKDGSREFVKKNFPKVKIVTDDSRNLGTATASNVAFAHTKGDYVIFQSNDIRLDKNCIKELVLMMENNPKIGITTSVLLNYYKDPKTNLHLIDNAGGIVDIFGFGMQQYPQKKISKIPQIGEVFFSYGGSFIIRREIFEKVGGFDDRFFTLNDDFDLSWRVRLLGYKIVYTKKSFVYHKVSATLSLLYKRSLKHYWSEKNTIRSFLKNSQIWHLLLVLPFYILLQIGQLAYFLIRLKFDMLLADLKAIAWNILYFPDTLVKRHKIQIIKKNNNISRLLKKTSFKLKLFKDFSRSL